MVDWQKCWLVTEMKFGDLIQIFDNHGMAELVGIVEENMGEDDPDVFVPEPEDTEYSPIPERCEEVVLVQTIMNRTFTDVLTVRREEGSNECYVDVDKLG